MEQCGVQSREEQLVWVAVVKTLVSSLMAEHGTERRKVRRGLVQESSLTASRVRSSQGRASRGEWARLEAGKVKSLEGQARVDR
jgi:hypothetical protein